MIDFIEIPSSELTLTPEEILHDYVIAYQSRQASLIGRREVLSGKAKFGIFGDGKEVPQVAMAHAVRDGDFRAGYYRDQTFMLALGLQSLDQFFAQLYAHADPAAEPHSAGRQMNAHFATRSLSADGRWRDLTEQINVSADLSPTGSQMPRLVGLGYASRLYRELEELQHLTQFSRQGNEVAIGTIGNASCAEGVFWEAVNAIGILQGPVVLSIWDDNYGISVTNKHQITKENLSELLSGFQREPGREGGFDLYRAPGWDYHGLVQIYEQAFATARRDHVPAIIHVYDLTQPQGHSTSGSHERYKSEQRLAWEEDHDGLKRMREWLVDQGLATDAELAALEEEQQQHVEGCRRRAWDAYQAPIRREIETVHHLLERLAQSSPQGPTLRQIQKRLRRTPSPVRKDIAQAIQEALLAVRHEPQAERQPLLAWKKRFLSEGQRRYSSHLYSETPRSALQVPEVRPRYDDEAPLLPGFEILNQAFAAILAREPRVIAFGEDLGVLGDVNQGFAGLQARFGALRVSDTGIREATIVGQAIGLAQRGLRPIAELQYLDYVLYALQIMADDLATMHWRTRGGQRAPVIIRTRGHRLEGVWHSGSPMAGIVNLIPGVHVLVPRDMTRAAGFYNTLLLGDEPGLVVEVLNGYRLREPLPANLDSFTVPVGAPEVIRPGRDVTFVTYGAMCRLALEAAEQLAQVDIDLEVIDVQSLQPFDVKGRIVESLQKTSRVVFADEDIPGGTTAFMMQQVIEGQGGYHWLDAEPVTLTARAHRPAYGTDGDYWSKPNVEQIFATVYEIMNEADPARYPIFYR